MSIANLCSEVWPILTFIAKRQHELKIFTACPRYLGLVAPLITISPSRLAITTTLLAIRAKYSSEK